jgi:hypothetical protein
MGRRRNARLHGGLGHRRRNLHDQARVEGFGDEVFRSKGQVLHAAVGRGNDIALLLAGQLGDGMHGGDFHGPGDGGGAHIQRAAEDEGKHRTLLTWLG